MIYRSKKDVWLVALVSGGFTITPLIGLYILIASVGEPRAGWFLLFIGAFTVALLLCLTYPLYYEITSSELKIRCGLLIRQQIPLSAIQEVIPTRNPLSAPAWSLDRLRINYRAEGEDGVTLISPSEKESFMRELVSQEPGLKLLGGRVVRASNVTARGV